MNIVAQDVESGLRYVPLEGVFGEVNASVLSRSLELLEAKTWI